MAASTRGTAYVSPDDFDPSRVTFDVAPGASGFPVLYRYRNDVIAPLRLMLVAPDTVAPFGLSGVFSSDLKLLKNAGSRLPKRTPDELLDAFAAAPDSVQWSLQIRGTPYVTAALDRVVTAILDYVPKIAVSNFHWKPGQVALYALPEGRAALVTDWIKKPKDAAKAAEYGTTVKLTVYPPKPEKRSQGSVFFTPSDALIPWEDGGVVKQLCSAGGAFPFDVPGLVVTFRLWSNTASCGVSIVVYQAQVAPKNRDSALTPLFPPSPAAAAAAAAASSAALPFTEEELYAMTSTPPPDLEDPPQAAKRSKAGDA
jgi:hypothetical protein